MKKEEGSIMNKNKVLFPMFMLSLTLCACGQQQQVKEEISDETVEEAKEYVNDPATCTHVYQLTSDSYESTDTESGLRHYLCDLCGDEYSYTTDPLVYTINPKTGEPVTQSNAYNPLLPEWEHIPDGEPHVYWSKDDNEWRVYLYGSHDDEGKSFCGLNYMLWSAPVYDLSDWRQEGKILEISEESTYGGFALFAPDADYDVTTDTYYMIASHMNTEVVLRKSDSPKGPFVENEAVWTISTKACYDPSLYIENGVIYVAGSCMKPIYSEIPEVWSLVEADGYSSGMSHIGVIYQLKDDPSDGDGIAQTSWMPNDERDFLPVYEGPSLTGYIDELGVYVYLYVANDIGEDTTSYTSNLAYMYTDDLMNGTWHYGENGVDEIYPELDYTISGNHGNTVSDVTGRYYRDLTSGEMTFSDFATYTYSNDHGGMAKINGNWYIFGHRHTNAHTSSRQTIAESINMYLDGDTPVIEPAEYTSSGIAGSIDAYEEIGAWRTCYILEAVDHPAPSTQQYNPHSDCSANTPYIVSTRDESATHAVYVTNIANNNVVGYKYLDFGENDQNVSLRLLIARPEEAADGYVDIYIDAPSESLGGTKLGQIEISTTLVNNAEEKETATDGTVWSWIEGTMEQSVNGQHGVYLVFHSDSANYICYLDELQFVAE
jgi:hypothetical protein